VGSQQQEKNMRFTFKADEKGVRLAAVFAAQLVKEGIVFSVLQDEFGIEIKLTGGF